MSCYYAEDSMPLTEILIADGRTYTTTRSYDVGNRPISHTYPSGETNEWEYDERNLVTIVEYEGERSCEIAMTIASVY